MCSVVQTYPDEGSIQFFWSTYYDSCLEVLPLGNKTSAIILLQMCIIRTVAGAFKVSRCKFRVLDNINS